MEEKIIPSSSAGTSEVANSYKTLKRFLKVPANIQ